MFIRTWLVHGAAKNPKQSLTNLKKGEEIKELDCSNPVSDHFRKGSLLGITGTPTIILEDGKKVFLVTYQQMN